MGKVIVGMTMSLDGYINDRHGGLEKLYPDFVEMHDVPSFQAIIENTGAVVMGRHAFDMGDPDSWGDYEFQTPIFVLTHTPPATPPTENSELTFTFVSEGIESAISQARSAAGDKDVQIIGGASTFQQSLNSGLCDELHLDLVPVLIGEGLRLFENIDSNKIELERANVEEMTSARTSFIFRIVT